MLPLKNRNKMMKVRIGRIKKKLLQRIELLFFKFYNFKTFLQQKMSILCNPQEKHTFNHQLKRAPILS